MPETVSLLRLRFEEFIQKNTNKRASETDFRRKGSLGVALIVTDTLLTKGGSFPLQPEDYLAEAGTQVRGLSGANVAKVLAKNGIEKSLGTEVGRTNRGASIHMRVYLTFLNEVQADGILDLNELNKFWIEKVEAFFAGKPFDLKLDPSLGLRSVVKSILKQAEERQKAQRGFNVAGTVAQHLVGAKLDLVLGEDNGRHHGANQNDVKGRHGDFLVNDVCFHVTTAPSVQLMEKCQANLAKGLRPIIITVYSRIAVAEALAEDLKIGARIDILEIEQFIATNIYELSRFEPAKRRVTVSELVDNYNRIISKYENDPSLAIQFLD